jgi:hypothetical protein
MCWPQIKVCYVRSIESSAYQGLKLLQEKRMDLEKISALIGFGKQLKSAYEAADDAQVRSLLAGFQEMATDARLEAVTAKEENVRLRERLMELESKAQVGAGLSQREDGLYYPDLGSGGPFCTRCYEADQRKITLQKKTRSRGGFATNAGAVSFGQDVWFECPQCKNEFNRHREG